MAAIKINSASSARGGVGCVDEESAAAGLDALRSGGNAADAAAAIILTACVTKIELCCIGGEGVGLVYDPTTGRSEVLCGQGASPCSEEAIAWYRRCLGMRNHEYQNSIDQRAEAGLNRLGAQ